MTFFVPQTERVGVGNRIKELHFNFNSYLRKTLDAKHYMSGKNLRLHTPSASM